MKFRNATSADVPEICALERLPQFRTLVGSWPEEQHIKALADPDVVYVVAENDQGRVAAFAISKSFVAGSVEEWRAEDFVPPSRGRLDGARPCACTSHPLDFSPSAR